MKNPKLRFKDFNDKWEHNKLEVFLIKNSERNKDLKINFIESVSCKFGFISQDELFSDRKMYGKDLSKYIVVQPTYFAYNPMALSSGSIAYKELNDNVSIVSPDYVSFTTNDLMNQSFLWYWIHTKNFENQRIVLTSGGVRSRLYFESLVQMQINVPSLEEQNYIGSFFKDLDHIITATKHKIDKLNDLKSNLLESLYCNNHQKTPNLRFEGYTNQWDSVSFSKLLTRYSSKNKDLKITYVETISSKHGFIAQEDYFQSLKVASKDLSNYSIIEPGSFAYNPGWIHVGSIAYKKFNEKVSIVSPLYISFKANELIDNEFLIYWFRTSEFERIRSLSTSNGVRYRFDYSSFIKFSIKMPSLEEQIKIRNLLNDVTSLIKINEQYLGNLEKQKQALLQRMFV
ncbi:restriction endonuclease subunit S [Psittacicella gerlachiana]|uniref:Type I restriction modification DNA specificity domain-containing protein n=1 Tax=Psittacicella gerlachiana TaxID=2028574 RepID=A0A3A1YIJ6_9GAMM|nr:restriction endonuclease subunit S [Psittacicella gerlachiana]RIY37089.1 hypothetical protein CKF59_02065 [Psittacicella gerlachiana]